MNRTTLFILLAICCAVPIQPSGQKSKVTIGKAENSWKLIVNGEHFRINGVVGNNFPEKIKKYGGNSVRMEAVIKDLDSAHELGLMSLVNLPAGAERYGVNYDDTIFIRQQTEKIVSIVELTKNHPAVLMWAIGNELDYVPPLEPFNPKVWDAVNQAAKSIHKVDPDHPVMTVIGTSMMWKVADIVKRCPDLDLLGINTYGDLFTLADTLKKYGWNKPYVITEWGPDGYWEVRRTPWGAPYEQTGLEKYNCYKKKYRDGILKNSDQCLGSFVFYWSGFKQETTHTWFCMFDEKGLESPMIGLMQELWTGRKPGNEAPILDSLILGEYQTNEPLILRAGMAPKATAFATDRDGDKLKYKWEVRREAVYASYAGQGEKVPEIISGVITDEGESVLLKTPGISGAYRLFVYVYDGNGHFSTANLPFFVSPELKDTLNLGQSCSRTLNLLHKSTPDRKNPVRILVYGQSISEQEWWIDVKKFIEKQFPYADIGMKNLAIGGFAAQILYKTIEMDVSTFYPDLVLLHIYGDPVYYDSVLYTIRSRTAAEVAIMTDHYTGPHSWSDTMSYHILPSLADRYNCDIINIRDSWKEFLSDNNLKPSVLLSDGTHLNRYGNFIMAELVKQFFVYRPQFPPDPYGLCRTYKIKDDIRFNGKQLTLPFFGNRVTLTGGESSGNDSLQVLVDGTPPSAFPGTYFITRPSNPDGRIWPWELPAMIRIRHITPWKTEKWKCTFTEVAPPYDDFSFAIEGSVTGRDGNGRSSEDFISPSGRIIIKRGDAEEGGDWHLKRSFTVLKTTVNNGDCVTWETYSISKDYCYGKNRERERGNTEEVLFQGIPNTNHVLKLKGTGRKMPAIKEINVYRPFLNN